MIQYKRFTVSAGFTLAVVPFVAHELSVPFHLEESERPGCVWMGAPCRYDHDGEPERPAPLPRLRNVEATITSSSMSSATTTFGGWSF